MIVTFCLQKLPKEPRLGTIPLPPVNHHYDNGGFNGRDGEDDHLPGGGINNHQSIGQWTPSARWAEATTSLAIAKPNNKENKVQSEVSKVFTPLEIVLYIDGLDNSQVVQLSQARVMVTIVPRILREGPAPRPNPRASGISSAEVKLPSLQKCMYVNRLMVLGTYLATCEADVWLACLVWWVGMV